NSCRCTCLGPGEVRTLQHLHHCERDRPDQSKDSIRRLKCASVESEACSDEHQERRGLRTYAARRRLSSPKGKIPRKTVRCTLHSRLKHSFSAGQLASKTPSPCR